MAGAIASPLSSVLMPLLDSPRARLGCAASSCTVTMRRGAEQPFRHGHNIVLDMALQLGVAGVIAFGALLAAFAVEFARAARVAATAPVGLAGLAMLAAFLAKNMTDDFLYRPNSLVFWALMGLLLRLAKPGTHPDFIG